jgi:hypothetical protein
MSVTRNSLSTGLVFWSIYPTFNASISHVVPEGRGSIAFGSAVASAPAIDPIRASVDPRLSWTASANWSLDRVSAGVSAGTAISIAQQNNNGAFNSLYAAANAGLFLGAGFSLDAGVRTFRQSVSGTATIPATYAAFLGISFNSAFTPGH